MGWTLLLGVAVLLGFGSAVTEYDNIPLETSPSSRKSFPRPIYTASYGVAPGEYVLRGSDHNHNSPSPIHGLGFLPREQAPPQEYLDLLRQTGVADGQRQQQNVKGRVVDQQYFGIQPSAPYLASGIIPSQGLNYDQPSIIPTSTFSPARQNVVVNIATGPGYPTALASPVSSSPVTPKTTSVSGSRKVLPYSASLSPSVARQGSGKAVQLTYSLDYDLASLHKLGGSSGRNAGSSAPSGPYYKEDPGNTVRGDKELLNQLAPKPSPLPFLPSFDDTNERKKSTVKTADGLDNDNGKDKIEVIKLPTPKGQRPITQAELLELIRAGYDVSPVEESLSQRQRTNLQQPSPGYQRAVVPQNPLLLPTTRGSTATTHSSENLRTPKTQPLPQTYLSGPGTAPSSGGLDATYYRSSSPAPLPLIRQQNIEPQVQTYQPGTSGIQAVQQPQQTYQKEADVQPQTYQTTESYVSQGFPSAPAQHQQEYHQLAGHQTLNYPTANGQQQQEYQQLNGEQGHIFQHPGDPQVQVYQPTGITQSQNEALSQPKEYSVPAPPQYNIYRGRGNQQYQPSSPSAPGNDEALTYQQALRPIPQGYSAIPSATGATSPGTTGDAAAVHGVTAHGETLPDDALLTGPGLEIQRTQPRRRTSRRKQNSQRESPITYVHRYEGDNTGYSNEK